MNIYYVYKYIDPISNVPYYIGKGKGNRCYKHLIGNKENKRFHNKNQKLLSHGINPIIEKVQENLTEDEAYNLEEQLIREYGRKYYDIGGVLLNVCESNRPPVLIGDRNPFYKKLNGENNPFYGKKHSEETKRKIGLASASRRHTEETKKRISDSLVGSNCYWYGKNRSEETKTKLANHFSKEWNIIDPDGNKFIIKNLRDFCRNNNLDHSHMIKVARGKSKQHKGYKCYYCAT